MKVRRPFARQDPPTARRMAIAAAGAAGAMLLTTLATNAGAAVDAGSSSESSANTVKGAGDFKDLTITVSQTKNLVNQAVEVTWTGGAATPGEPGTYPANFLHIMQCWGNDPAAATFREQCQFGGFSGNPDLEGKGTRIASRTVFTNHNLAPGLVGDPNETLAPTRTFDQNEAYLPFRPASGAAPIGGNADEQPFLNFFSVNTTNEVFSRTNADGSGQAFFEVQTLRESHGLGCGAPHVGSEGNLTGSRCWLVIVPRGTKEVDGSERKGNEVSVASDWVKSSPLNASNWSQRITVPLEFEPVGGSCRLGRAERGTLGSITASDAVLRWQPALCAADGPVYSYSTVPEVIARRKLVSATPGMVFVKNPVPPSEVPAGKRPKYVPIALSGFGVAFNIERATTPGASKLEMAGNGTPVTELNLTPRLLAKLLTQSYRNAALSAPSVAGNPANITGDEDFLRFNPVFRKLYYVQLNITVDDGLSDGARQAWDWIVNDPEAKAFLDGNADEYGMTINPKYAALTLPREDFPKLETHCITGSQPIHGLLPLTCTLDEYPYANDIHHSVQSAARGNTLARVPTYDEIKQIIVSKPGAPQQPGKRAILAFTDTVSAARFGLRMARLRNAAGSFIAPGDATLLEGLAGMAPSGVPGVLTPDPLLGGRSYPLTSLTYAATVPDALSEEAQKDYANFLRYAVVGGQIPGEGRGQLPAGYVPLPQQNRIQALQLADELARPLPTSTPTATTAATAAPTPTTTSAAPSPSRPPTAPVTAPPALARPPAAERAATPTSRAPSASTSATVSTTPSASAKSVVTPAPSSPMKAAGSSGTAPSVSQSPSPSRPNFGSTGGVNTGRNPAGPRGGGGTLGIPALPAAASGQPLATLPQLAKPSKPSAPLETVQDLGPQIEETPGPQPVLSVPVAATPHEPLGPERYAFVALLVLGLVAAATAGSGPVAARAAPFLAPAKARLAAATTPARAAVSSRVGLLARTVAAKIRPPHE